MMKIQIAALLAAMALPLTALAQNDALPEWRPAGRLDALQGQEVGPEIHHEISLGFRFPILGGENNNMTSDKWSDVYRPVGFGFLAQYSALFKASPVVSVGPYFAFSTDVFIGDLIEINGGADLVDLDPISETRLLFGARVREQWGHFFMDQNIGIGPVFYGVGTGVAGFLGTERDVEVIASSASFAFEIGLRLGVAVSRVVDLGLGFVYELNGAPERGKDVQDPGWEFKAQSNFTISLLINLNF
jgi:hypothetical protein